MALGELFGLSRGLFVERIGRRYQDRFAHSIEWQDAPALAQLFWKGACQFHIHIIHVNRQITNSCSLADNLKRNFQLDSVLMLEGLDKWLRYLPGRLTRIPLGPPEV